MRRLAILLLLAACGQGAPSGSTSNATASGATASRPSAHTPELDAIIARYKAAGCAIGFCPGPSPHETRCERNSGGKLTCGGM